MEWMLCADQSMQFSPMVTLIQCSPLIMLCLGSIGLEHFISEPCYKGTILLRNYYNSFVKFHGKKIWEPQHDQVISKSVLYRGVL